MPDSLDFSAYGEPVAPMDALIDTHAARAGVPRDLLAALLKQESGGNPNAVNVESGAAGAGQLMPATAKELGVTDRFDPGQSIGGAADYLKRGLDKYGNVDDALKFYYGGPNEKLWGPRTLAYPDQVKRHLPEDRPDAAPLPDFSSFGEPVRAAAPASSGPQSKLLSEAGTKQPKGGNTASDLLELGKQGLITAAQDVHGLTQMLGRVGVLPGYNPELDDAATAALTGKTTSDHLKDWLKTSNDRLTPEQADANAKKWWDSDKGWFGPAWGDWRSYANGVITSLPETFITMVPGGVMARGAYLAKRAAVLGSDAVVGMSEKEALKFATTEAAKSAATVAGITGQFSEGSLGGVQSHREVAEAIDKMTPEQLGQSAAYQSLLQQGLTPEAAKARLVSDGATQAFWLGGIATGIFGGMGDRFLARALAGTVQGGVLKRMAKGAVSEGLFEEFPQGVAQQIGQNYALRGAKPDQPLMDDALNQGFGGLAAGGVMGAGFGMAGHKSEASPRSSTTTGDNAPIPAQDVLGAVQPDAATQTTPPAAAAAPGAPTPAGPVVSPTIQRIDALIAKVTGVAPAVVAAQRAAAEASGTPGDSPAPAMPSAPAIQPVPPGLGSAAPAVSNSEASRAAPDLPAESGSSLELAAPASGALSPATAQSAALPASTQSVPESASSASPQSTGQSVAPESQPSQAGAVDEAAHVAATSPQNALPEPTDAQKEAGNYQKGHTRIAGLDISVENPEGSRRRPEWPPMKSHYGYIRGTIGKDKDHIDAFVRPSTPEDYAGPVFVVDQKNGKGLFDEHKVMIGWSDQKAARAGYLENYTKGFKGLGAITQTTLPEFKQWLATGNTTKPYASYARNADKNASPGATNASIMGGNAQISDKNATKRAAPVETRTPGKVNNSNLKRDFQKMGIDRTEQQDITGEKKARHTGSMPGTFRKDGMTIDDWGTRLVEDGWLLPESQSQVGNEDLRASSDDVREFVRKVLSGEEVHRIGDQAHEASRKDAIAHSEWVEAEAARMDEPFSAADLADLAESHLTREENEVDFDAAAVLADLPEAARESILERAAMQAQNEADYEQIIRSLAAAEHAHPEGGARDRGQAGRSESGASADDRRSGAESTDNARPAERTSGREEPANVAPAPAPKKEVPKQPKSAPVGETDKGAALRAKLTSEETKALQARGTADFANGAKRLVPRDLTTIPKMDAWYRGWDLANVAAPVPEAAPLELTASTEAELKSQSDAAKAAADKEAADNAAAEKLGRDEATRKEVKDRSTAAAGTFELGQSAEQNLTGQGDMLSGPAPTTKSPDELRAIADLQAGLADLGDILGKGTKLNITPEQEQKLLPVLTRIFDAAFRLGHIKFKQAARYVLDQIRTALGPDLANAVTLEHLQGGYIAMSGRYKAQGADGIADVAGVPSLDALNEPAPSATNAQETQHVPGRSTPLESNRGDTTAPQHDVGAADETGRRRADEGARHPGGPTELVGGPTPGDSLVSDGGTAPGRERGDLPIYPAGTQSLPSELPPGVDDDQRSDLFGEAGLSDDTGSGDETPRAADEAAIADKRTRQRAAAALPVKPGDISNIRDTLPFLQPAQQDDVLFAEQRFAKPDGHGVLFTNGTGTGKTYTGLGLVYRAWQQGKRNILIIAPQDKVIGDWIDSGENLGLSISRLADTKDAGRGIAITTYENLGQNDALSTREWDLVITDEAHKLSQAAHGGATSFLGNLRAITAHPDGGFRYVDMRLPQEGARVRAAAAEITRLSGSGRMQLASDHPAVVEMAAARADYDAKAKPLREAYPKRVRGKVTMLSATPFAYEKSVDLGEGYLFDYPKSESTGYNVATGFDRFMVDHFGYRMRYNKLTEPGPEVDRGLMQRQFNGWLKKQGVLSGRALDVPHDYDRKFVLIDSKIGQRIDQALEWFWNGERSKSKMALNDMLRAKFDYLSRRYLLEAIKAESVVPIIREHHALGRKVVVFHDYKKGGGFHPFRLNISPDMKAPDGTPLYPAWQAFSKEFADLIDFPFHQMRSPLETLQREFPDALIFNGDVPAKKRREAIGKFNADDSPYNLIVMQTAAGKEGISVHDTSSKHQRALINLGLPTQPTTAIQQEGRIFRVGQASDAMFRYLNTGTSWERDAFAQTIARRASTAENLAMGEGARGLLDAFVQAFEDSDMYPPGHDGEGKGGKARDRAFTDITTDFQRAKSYYFGQQKKTSRTKAAEGTDYFATPEPLGLKMVEWADVRPSDSVLEPSAGHGAIARWLPDNATRTAIEPSSELSSRLALAFDGKMLQERFEDHHVVNKYDAIVMNPPFGTAGKTAMEHIAKAATHLRDGGRIVALIPDGPSMDKRLEKWLYEGEAKAAKPVFEHPTLGPIYKGDTVTTGAAWAPRGVVDKMGVNDYLMVKTEGAAGTSGVSRASIKSVEPGPRTEWIKSGKDFYLAATIGLPPVTFERAGTSITTRIVVLEKQTNTELAPQQQARDLRSIDNIGGLFNAIEDMSFRGRPETVAPPVNVNTTQPSATVPTTEQKTDEEIVEHTTQAGKVLRGVIRMGIGLAEAKAIDPYTWKKDGGYFIREKYLKKPDLSRALLPIVLSGGRRGTTLARASLDSIVNSVRRKWTDAPPIVVVKDPQDIAPNVPDDANGAYWRGKVYIIASNIRDVKHAYQILAHEIVGHASMNDMLGDKFADVVKEIQLRKTLGNTTINRLAQSVRETHGELTPEKEAAEIIARATEEAVDAQGNVRPEFAWLKRIWSIIADWLRARGIAVSFTPAEMQGLISRAAQRLDQAQAAPAMEGEPALSRGTTTTMPGGTRTVTSTPFRETDAGTRTTVLDAIQRRLGGEAFAKYITMPLWDRFTALGGRIVPDRVKAGIAGYTLPEPYVALAHDRSAAINSLLRDTKRMIDAIQFMDRTQARVAYQWMSEVPSLETETQLLTGIPEDGRAVLREMKSTVADLGRRAVDLGLLSQEVFDRNNLSYLRRSYLKHEESMTAGQKAQRKRAIALRGDNFKKRGLRDDAAMTQIVADGVRRELGKADTSLKGKHFTRLERRDRPTGTANLTGMEGENLGRLREVVYVDPAKVGDDQFKGWRNDGEWEARFFDKGAKVGMWRDFTADEQQRMGVIDEVRYSFAKTMLNMVHDVETAQFLKYVGKQFAKTSPDEVTAAGGTVVQKIVDRQTTFQTFKPNEWAQVPSVSIPGTGLLKYGALAGRFIPGSMWNDIRSTMNMRHESELAEVWDKMMRTWKLSKTALSPAVHMNNVMSNFILADLADVRARDMARSLLTLYKARQGDADAKIVMQHYQDSGAELGSMLHVDLRRDVMEPILKQLEGLANESANDVGVLAHASQIMSLALHGHLIQASQQALMSKPGRMAKWLPNKLIEIYGKEDMVFRLAAFLKSVDEGKTHRQAGDIARKAFLDYQINAPWVQAARRTGLPFIAFSYRAIPLLIDGFVKTPWKMAKYAAVGGGLNALAYAMMGLGGDDEDKERRLLPDELQGRALGIFPRLLRMPWNDEHGSPVFLDVRRWIPGGDIVDTNQSHGAISLPSWLGFGGPLAMLIELSANRSLFTGQAIVKDSDTAAEKITKVVDYLYKFWMPNIPNPLDGVGMGAEMLLQPSAPTGFMQTYNATRMRKALAGETDQFGRDVSTGEAALGAIGVKVHGYPADELTKRAVSSTNAQVREIGETMGGIRRQYSRGGLSDVDAGEKLRYQAEKQAAARKKLAEKVGAGLD